jgi:ATP-dependent helicase/nuclease subunit B
MFGRLGGFIGRLLEKMGRELKSGCIAANPLEKGEAHSPCLYCPYKEACAFDSGRDKARKQHSIDEDEFWRHIAEGGE